MNNFAFAVAMATLNLANGLGGAMWLVRMLCPAGAKTRLRVRFFFGCLAVYFLECMAFPAGMATQVFVVALAFVWGAVVGSWLPRLAPLSRPWRIPLWVGFYTSWPTLTFCLVLPYLCAWVGRDILSPKAGVQFGMPDFVPAPFQTILGFCLLLGFGTLSLKCAITTGMALWVLRRGNRREANQAVRAAAPQRGA